VDSDRVDACIPTNIPTPEDAEKIVLNAKGVIRPGPKPDGDPDFVRNSVLKCLEMLGPRGRLTFLSRVEETPVCLSGKH
jgi:hypothetical protein